MINLRVLLAIGDHWIFPSGTSPGRCRPLPTARASPLRHPGNLLAQLSHTWIAYDGELYPLCQHSIYSSCQPFWLGTRHQCGWPEGLRSSAPTYATGHATLLTAEVDSVAFLAHRSSNRKPPLSTADDSLPEAADPHRRFFTVRKFPI